MSRALWPTLRSLRALARVELRQLRLHPRRTWLLLALVALPVAAVVGGATLARITESTPEEQRVQAMGRAAMRVDGIEGYGDVERVVSILPEGTRWMPLFVGAEDVQGAGRRLTARLLAAAAEDLEPGGLAAGMVELVLGGLPRNAGEVALSPSVLEGLGGELGGLVVLEFGVARTVTGIVVDPESVEAPLVVRTPAASEHRGRKSLLVGTSTPSATEGMEELATAIERLPGEPLVVRRRAGEGRRSDTGLLIFALGCLGFFEAALVIAAAFGISVRRRQREIGLLGASGATSRGIWGSLLVSAAVVSLVGGAIGSALGVGVAALVHPWLDGWNQRWNGPFEISIGHIGLGILLGVATALLAATLPARSASRQSIRIALGGSRPPRDDSRQWLKSGVLLVTTGALLTLLAAREGMVPATLGVIVGPVFGLLGFGLCSRWILHRMARLAGGLPLAWRLAIRDAGRFRGRNGPVVTAILAGMAMSVTVAVLVASLETAIAWIPSPYRSDQIQVSGMEAEAVARQMVSELDALDSAPLAIAYLHGEPLRAIFTNDRRAVGVGKTIAIGGQNLLRTMGAEAAAGPFERGLLVALQPPENPGPLVVSSWIAKREVHGIEVALAPAPERVAEPAFLLNERFLDGYGLTAGPPIRRSLVPWIVRFPRSVDEGLLVRASGLAEEAAGTSVDASLRQIQPPMTFYYLALALCGLTGLAIVLVANALSVAESAGDELTLLTVGASPGLVRRHAAARAAYLALLGCGLAIPAGLLPSRSLFATSNFPIAFVMPWGALALTLLALPTVAYAAAWLLARPRRNLRAREIAGCLLLGLMLSEDVALGRAPAESASTIGVPSIEWTEFLGEAFDGSPLPGELGRIVVPMTRFHSGGGIEHSDPVEIAFVRYRTTNPSPGAPIFFLAGGPGGSGIEHGGQLATHPQLRLLEHRDVVAIDQRGTGLSRPNLVDLDFEIELAPSLPTSRQATQEAFTRLALEAVSFWRERGVDPASWNTRESAADLDAVRRALGVERVVLFGSSYGSHLGLAYLRAFDPHVERALLTKVEGPDDTWKLPSTVDRVFDAWSAQTVDSGTDGGEARPALRPAVEALLVSLASNPVRVPSLAWPGESIWISPFDLRVFLARHLASIAAMETLPEALESMVRGDWSPLRETSEANRQIAINAMTLLMDCASGGSRARRDRIERERHHPEYLLSDVLAAPFFPESCDPLEVDLGDQFRSRPRSAVPVLFVSGTLDARTPPENVEAILSGFSQASHVVVENSDHDARELMSSEYRAMVQAFLRGEAVPSATLELPRPRLDWRARRGWASEGDE